MALGISGGQRRGTGVIEKGNEHTISVKELPRPSSGLLSRVFEAFGIYPVTHIEPPIPTGASFAIRGKETRPGINEDTGYADRISQAMTASQGQDLLKQLFSKAREITGFAGKNVGAVAAGAVITSDQVAIRSCGDAIACAVGANGQVVLLNELQHGAGQSVTNALIPGVLEGEQGGVMDFVNTYSLQGIRDRLDLKADDRDPVIITMSDGANGWLHEESEIAAHFSNLIKNNGLYPYEKDFAAKLLAAAVKDPVYEAKPDDLVILAGQVPRSAGARVLLAVDGMGGGGPESGRYAQAVIGLAKDTLEKFRNFLQPGRAPGHESGGAADAFRGAGQQQHQKEISVRELNWQIVQKGDIRVARVSLDEIQGAGSTNPASLVNALVSVGVDAHIYHSSTTSDPYVAVFGEKDIEKLQELIERPIPSATTAQISGLVR